MPLTRASSCGKYHACVSFGFGEDVDLTGTVVGLTLKTDDFPRD